MNRDELVATGLGLLILALEWMWAHRWTLGAVVFGLAVLYQLGEIRRLALGVLWGFNALQAAVEDLKDAVEDLKNEVDNLKDEVVDLRSANDDSLDDDLG